MGQKVHPYGFRLGVNKPWRSRWFSERDYDKLLVEDVKLKAELREKLKAAGVSSVEIERPGNKLRFLIRTARPGIVIGRKGAEIEKLKTELGKRTNRDVFIDIIEVEGWIGQIRERLSDSLVGRRVAEVPADVPEPRREPGEDLLVERLAAVGDRLAGTVHQLLDAPIVDCHAHDREIQQLPALEPVQRPECHLPRQVSGDPEDDQCVGWLGVRHDAEPYPLPPARSRCPRLRSRLASAMSAAVTLPSSRPVSSTHGRSSNRGSDRNTARPLAPSSPFPGTACRSRLEPSGVIESLRCSECSRSSPTVRSHSASVASSPSGVPTS